MRIRIDLRLESGRNRCQFLFTLPISVAVGGLGGWQIATALQVDPWIGLPAGALAVTAFVYAQLLVEPAVVDRLTDDSGRFDGAVAFAWDSLTGSVVGLVLFWFLGTQPLPAIASAAALGAAYGYVSGWIVCGEGVALFTGAVLGGIGRTRPPDYSWIEALEARGEHRQAAAAYEAVLAEHPGHVQVAGRLARLLARALAEPDRAVAVLRRALEGGHAPPSGWAYALRLMLEIQAARPGGEGACTPDLRALVAAHPADPAGAWARERLASIAAEARALEAVPPPDGGDDGADPEADAPTRGDLLLPAGEVLLADFDGDGAPPAE